MGRAALAAGCLAMLAGCGAPSPPPAQTGEAFFFADHLDGARLRLATSPDGPLRRSLTLDDETLAAIAAPVPSEIAYTVTVPEDAVLRFAVGASVEGPGPLPARVAFRVRVEGPSGSALVFERTLRRFEPNAWLPQDVDLDAWSGETVRLRFETEAEGPRAEAAGGLVAAWGHPVLAPRRSRPRRPPLVLVSIDCLRADHVGAYGYPRPTTPALDELAAEALVFETALAPAPETLPSHLTMLTGLAPSLHGGDKWRLLPEAVPYLPALLAHAGYAVHGVVTGAYLSQSFGVQRGFHAYRFLDDPPARVAVDRALERLGRLDGQDFFFFLHLFDPHWPYVPPDDVLERFGPRPEDLSGLMERVAEVEAPLREEERRHVVDLYDAEIAAADRELGRFLDALRERGLYDEALIVVTGDHGEAFFEHGFWQHTMTLYEEMLRVPLVVKWPGGVRRGRVREPVGLGSIFATLAETAGLAVPADPERAPSLARRGESDADAAAAPIVSEVHWSSRPPGRIYHLVALRRGEEKYIARLVRRSGEPPDRALLETEELYDLGNDPSERRNVVEMRTRSARAFRRHLEDFLAEAARRWAARGPAQDVTMDERIEERLRSLGYLP